MYMIRADVSIQFNVKIVLLFHIITAAKLFHKIMCAMNKSAYELDLHYTNTMFSHIFMELKFIYKDTETTYTMLSQSTTNKFTRGLNRQQKKYE